MKSKIALFFMILISFLLQCTLLHVISIGSITPNLILILCISMGLMRMHCSFCSGDVWGSEPIYTGLFYRRFFIQ